MAKVNKHMEKKITKREHFESLLAIGEVASRPELVAFIEHELELLEKKNASRQGEMTETQKENAKTSEEILAWVGDREITISQVRAKFGLSPQKATPIMNGLVKAGKLVKRVEKRVSYFKRA